ncbi:hypothetical protein BDF19DRAFT_464948 [Syncephalis fuscata]|nr:hypothetical protein BDF19DRAFT_464948 [Syncephalis fuscata]
MTYQSLSEENSRFSTFKHVVQGAISTLNPVRKSTHLRSRSASNSNWFKAVNVMEETPRRAISLRESLASLKITRARSVSMPLPFTESTPLINIKNPVSSIRGVLRTSIENHRRSASASASISEVKRSTGSMRRTRSYSKPRTPIPTPPRLSVSGPIECSSTGGLVDRRRTSRNEWLRSSENENRKSIFFQHRSIERHRQTTSLYDPQIKTASLARSVSISTVYVNKGAPPSIPYRSSSPISRPSSAPMSGRRVSTLARLCAAGFVLSASHSESEAEISEDKSSNSFDLIDFETDLGSTFLFEDKKPVPAIPIRVSLNKSKLVQLAVAQTIKLGDLKMRISAKF